jgi:hypothetical protein
LQTRLQSTLQELSSGVQDLENKIRGAGAAGPGPVTQQLSVALESQKREIELATAALSGTPDVGADTVDRVSGMPAAALQAELLALMGQMAALRSVAAAQGTELGRWRDLRLEASALLEALRTGKGRLTAEQIELIADSLNRLQSSSSGAVPADVAAADVVSGSGASDSAVSAALRSQLIAEKGRSEALRQQVRPWAAAEGVP